MRLQYFGAVVVAAFSLLLSAPAAHAFLFDSSGPRYEMIDRETGRSIGPINRRGMISGSPVSRSTVSFDGGRYGGPGSIVVNTAERRLYYVLNDGQAVKYGIGVGRDGFRWSGVHKVTGKREWPDWVPPEQMLKRQPNLPRYMKGGPENPLGARAIYLGSTLYRIHGSNEPETIGEAVSSGCFRMSNEDVIDLYDRVRVGATVTVLQ
jgi:lipoprotein-anchoring transpeptidase ErfK/SrfK